MKSSIDRLLIMRDGILLKFSLNRFFGLLIYGLFLTLSVSSHAQNTTDPKTSAAKEQDYYTIVDILIPDGMSSGFNFTGDSSK